MLIEEKIKIFSKDYAIDISKTINENTYFYATIVFDTQNFLELQKNLFNEFIVNIIQELEKEDFDLENFKDWFEKSLQAFNSKLNLFAQKLNLSDKIKIRWVIQILIDEIYINSMIWEVSTLIFRNDKLSYHVENDISEWDIDLFSEYLEWEVEDRDEIICLGILIQDFFSKQDIQQAIEIAKIEERPIVDILEEMVWAHMQLSKLGFISYLKVNIPFYGLDNNKKNIWNLINIKKIDFKKIKKTVEKNKVLIIFSLLVIFIFWGIYSFINKLIFTDNVWKDVEDEMVLNCNTADIYKQINDLKYIVDDWQLKTEKYNQIKQTISECKKLWYALADMDRLAKTLEWEYFKTFNIFFVQKLSDNKIFSSTEDILEKIWNVLQIVVNKYIYLFGNRGAIFDIINQKDYGKIFEFRLTENIWWCNLGFERWTFYCFSTGGNLYYISKNTLKKVVSDKGFPSFIVDIDKYSTNRLFVLTNQKDFLDKWSFVLRYDRTNDVVFAPYKEYQVNEDDWKKYKDKLLSGFSDFVVDNSWFLLFSKKDKNIYLMKRIKGYGNYSTTIWEIKRKWWPTKLQKFSNNVKIITTYGVGKDNYSKYIYLFDRDNKSIWVYQGPDKRTNPNFNVKNFVSLNYKFLLKLDDFDVKDVDVKIKWTPILYILEKTGDIYMIDLAEYFYYFENENR